ncbi:MAG: hypothetical protein PW788_04930 [Micavibrio sp.]|nr:hypothetical protein [Micavibrio sp.]
MKNAAAFTNAANRPVMTEEYPAVMRSLQFQEKVTIPFVSVITAENTPSQAVRQDYDTDKFTFLQAQLMQLPQGPRYQIFQIEGVAAGMDNAEKCEITRLETADGRALYSKAEALAQLGAFDSANIAVKTIAVGASQTPDYYREYLPEAAKTHKERRPKPPGIFKI